MAPSPTDRATINKAKEEGVSEADRGGWSHDGESCGTTEPTGMNCWRKRETRSHSFPYTLVKEARLAPLRCPVGCCAEGSGCKQKAHQGILPIKQRGHRVGAEPGGSRRRGSASVEGTLVVQTCLIEAVDGAETCFEALPQSQSPRGQTAGA